MKKEGKSIYYAIRFHAGKHSIPSSVQLTIPLFRRNSPHSPRHTKGEGRGRAGGGRASSSPSGSTALFLVLPLDHYILGFG